MLAARGLAVRPQALRRRRGRAFGGLGGLAPSFVGLRDSLGVSPHTGQPTDSHITAGKDFAGFLQTLSVSGDPRAED